MLQVGVTPVRSMIVSAAGPRRWLFFAFYLAGAELGHFLSFPHEPFATFWPPAGLFLAALMLRPYREWPWIALLGFGANLFSDVVLHETPLPKSLGFSAINVIEACLGAGLLRRFVGETLRFTTQKEVIGLVAYAAILSASVGALLGASFLVTQGTDLPFFRNWWVWWSSDSIGILLVTPLFLVERETGVPRPLRRLVLRRIELAAAFLGMLGISWMVFNRDSPPESLLFRFPYVVTFPFLIWIGIRFSPRTVAAAMFSLATLAIWRTTQGTGPFTWVTSGEANRAFLLQIFTYFLYLTSMCLCASFWEYRKADAELRSSRELLLRSNLFLQAILDSAKHKIISTDPDGIILSFNSAAERALGYKAEDLIGKATPALFHDADEIKARALELTEELGHTVEAGFEAFVAKARLGEVDEREWTYIRKDGTRYPVRLSVTALREPGGRISGFLGIASNITEQRKAEEALRAANYEMEYQVLVRTFALADASERLQESLERFRQLADSMPQMVWAATPDGVLDYYNQRWYDFTGFERESDQDRGWIPLLHPDDVSLALKNWNSSVASGEPSECEYRFHDRNSGRYLWHLGRARPVRNDRGEIVRWFGSFTDIDSLKQTEEALRESEARQARAISAARLGHWEWEIGTNNITHLGGKDILYGLEEHEDLSNYEEFCEIVHPDDNELLKQSVIKCIENGGPHDVEFRIIWPDGSIRWISSKGGLFRDAVGVPLRMAGVNIDITERKVAEFEVHKLNEDLERRVAERTLELAKAKEIAENAARAKGEFLANMSHEIRTPMNGVIGMTELLLETRLNDLQRDYASTIHNSAEALLTVINDILDLSKIEAGKMNLETASFDLRALMEEVADLLAPRAHQKHLQITSRVDPGIATRIIGDPIRVRQILTNLAANAVKFTDAGEVKLNAEVIEASDDQSVIRISVIDSGCGIPREFQAKVFESFTQVESGSSRPHGGTGLGLTICRHLIGLMGGVIGLESEPGVGSKFWCDLPLHADPECVPRGAEAWLGGLRILVVDDNETNRQILREALVSWSCESTEVRSGSEAVNQLQARGSWIFDLILIDLEMPEMNGVETAEAIRRIPQYAKIPLVLLSSAGVVVPSESCAHAPFQAALMKPIRIARLAQVLGKLLGRSMPLIAGTPESETTKTFPGLAILLAEDNQVNRRVALGMFKKLGCELDIAVDGEEAVRMSGLQDYDIILMDIQMPRMDGFQATGKIRERERISGRRATIIAMTAHAMEGDAERCLAAGMDDYLAKPLRYRTLETVIARWCEAEGEFGPPHNFPSENVLGDAEDDTDGGKDFQPFLDTCDGDTEMVREILELTLESVHERLGRITPSIAARDASAIQFEAHALKGVFLTIGFADEAGICENLIQLAIAREFGQLDARFEEFQQCWNRLREKIRGQIKRLSLTDPLTAADAGANMVRR